MRYDRPGPARPVDTATREQASGAQAQEATHEATPEAGTQTVQLVHQVLAAPEVAFCLIALGLLAVTVWLRCPP